MRPAPNIDYNLLEKTETEHLHSTTCYVIVDRSDSGFVATQNDRQFDALGHEVVWFRWDDGRVDMTDMYARWFLGGQKVESYICL